MTENASITERVRAAVDMASIWDETTYSVEYDAARDCYIITENGRPITDLFPSFVERNDTTAITGEITDIRHERYNRWELR